MQHRLVGQSNPHSFGGQDCSQKVVTFESRLIDSSGWIRLFTMFGNWLYLTMILATAIQQIVGGVSCCCLSRSLFHPAIESAVEKSQTNSGEPGTRMLRCSKCKPGAKLTLASNSNSLGDPVLSSDSCDCRHANPTSLIESKLSKSLRFYYRGPPFLQIGLAPASGMHHDLRGQDRTGFSRFVLQQRHLAALESIRTRLSWLGLWII